MPYTPRSLGENPPKNMMKTLTKILQVYHHLAAIMTLSSMDLWNLPPDYWVQFWGQPEEDPSIILTRLYDYYYQFIPLLWTSFKQFFTTPEQIEKDFTKVLKWYQERISGDVYDIQKARNRIQTWISFLTLEIVIPTRHRSCPNPQLKFKYWRLPELSKTIAIVGDSNLSRIEPFAHPSCQIESYPGARIEHLVHMFSNYDHQKVPTILILSIGINDATRSSNLQTNIGTILSILPANFESTRKIFVQLQASKHQPEQVHTKVQQLNSTVPVEFKIIPGLSCFETGRDNVHWTPSCAKSLLNHWLSNLY